MKASFPSRSSSEGGASASSVSTCHIAIGHQGRAFSLAYHSGGVAWEPYIADVVLLCCGWGVADVAPVRVNTVRAWIRGCFPRAPVRIVPHVPLCVSPRREDGGEGTRGGWVGGGGQNRSVSSNTAVYVHIPCLVHSTTHTVRWGCLRCNLARLCFRKEI